MRIRCTNCNNLVSGKSAFCSSCGAPLSNSTPQPTRGTSGVTIILSVIILLLIGALVACYFVFLHPSQRPTDMPESGLYGLESVPPSITNPSSPLETFVNQCHERYFTTADISSFDEASSLIARNAVYAHSGRMFQNEKWQKYFARYAWYTPSVDPSIFSTNMFNEYQAHNLQLILDFDKRMGYNRNVGSTTTTTVTPAPVIVPDTSALQTFIAQCHQRYFTRAEISSFNADMSLIARNAVYAHSGRMFNGEKWRDYFSQYSWYTPYIAPSAFKDSMLNKYQAANLKLLLNYDKEMGYN